LAIILIWQIISMLYAVLGDIPSRELFRAPKAIGLGRVGLAILGSPSAFALSLFLTGCVALTYASPRTTGSRWRLPVLLALAAYAGSWILLTRPRPTIDVLVLQEEGARHLVRGENPYAASYPNPYGQSALLPAEVQEGDKIVAFPYPPLSILMAVPGHLAGDVRWSHLAAALLAAWFMVACGRRLGLPRGHPAELAAIAFLYHPRWFMVLEKGWTEPFLVLAGSLSAWAIAAKCDLSIGLGLAGLCGLKQYGFLTVPALWRAGPPRGIRWLAGPVAVIVFTAIFIIWEPQAFWRGIVTWLLRSPFRSDSLSIPAIVYEYQGHQLPTVLGLVAAIVVGALVLRQRLTLSQAALGNSAILLAFILMSKAAHMNYFWWAGSWLPLALIAAAAEDGRPT
jgi:hypothetical protein